MASPSKVLLLALLPFAFCAVDANLFDFGRNAPLRDSFQVTFGINPFKSFKDLPRTVAEVKEFGFEPLLSEPDCTNGGIYNGNRYISSSGDPAITLLFDKNGVIAGIQMNTKQSAILAPENHYDFAAQPMYTSGSIRGVEVFTITAYFIEPSKICAESRAVVDLEREGTATGLWLQNGPTPNDLIVVPNNRMDAHAEGWSLNNCFVGMGKHNFFESEKVHETNCTTFRPIVLLYNKEDTLIGFGFITVGMDESIDGRFEHPNDYIVKMIVGDDAAQCLLDEANSPGFTAIHVYFTDKNIIRYNCL